MTNRCETITDIMYAVRKWDLSEKLLDDIWSKIVDEAMEKEEARK